MVGLSGRLCSDENGIGQLFEIHGAQNRRGECIASQHHIYRNLRVLFEGLCESFDKFGSL